MAASTAKRNANIVIGLFLAIMALTPLSYYTVRSDPHDERFAWRMFSSVRMVRCSPTWTVGPPHAKVRLGRTFHEAWVGIAKRGRLSVVDEMTDHLCAVNPGKNVRLHLACRGIDGQTNTLEDGKRDLCEGSR